MRVRCDVLFAGEAEEEEEGEEDSERDRATLV